MKETDLPGSENKLEIGGKGDAVGGGRPGNAVQRCAQIKLEKAGM